MDININSSTIVSYRDFMRTLQKLLYAAWGRDKVMFVSAYPSNADSVNIKTPIITYSVSSKKAGSFKTSSEIKSRLRDVIRLENEEGNEFSVELFGQVFEYRILFECWAEDGDSADELLERFQRFMSQYTGYLKKEGALEVIFESADGNESEFKWKTDLIKRNIVYYVRLDEITSAQCGKIEEITIATLLHDNPYNMVLNLIFAEKGIADESLYEDRAKITNNDGG